MNIIFHIIILLFSLYVYILTYNFNIKNNILEYHKLNDPPHDILNNYYNYKQPIVINYKNISNFYKSFINNENKINNIKKDDFNINFINNYNSYNILNSNKLLYPKNNLLNTFKFIKKNKDDILKWSYNLEEITNIIVLKGSIEIRICNPNILNNNENYINNNIFDNNNILDINNIIKNKNAINILNKNYIKTNAVKDNIISIPAYWLYYIKFNDPENLCIVIKHRNIINIISIIKVYIENKLNIL